MLSSRRPFITKLSGRHHFTRSYAPPPKLEGTGQYEKTCRSKLRILSKYWKNCFFKNFYCYSITVVCLFSPFLHPTPAEPTSLPRLHPPPWFCPCVLYSSSCNTLSPLSPPHSPLVIVRLFLTSMSLVIFCLLFSFVDYVPVKGEIIWYLSLTSWLISLSIMLWKNCFWLQCIPHL